MLEGKELYLVTERSPLALPVTHHLTESTCSMITCMQEWTHINRCKVAIYKQNTERMSQSQDHNLTYARKPIQWHVLNLTLHKSVCCFPSHLHAHIYTWHLLSHTCWGASDSLGLPGAQAPQETDPLVMLRRPVWPIGAPSRSQWPPSRLLPQGMGGPSRGIHLGPVEPPFPAPGIQTLLPFLLQESNRTKTCQT